MNAQTPDILSAEAYEALVLHSLSRVGFTPDEARAVAKDRWASMDGDGAISECRGRGLVLTREDLADFVKHKFHSDYFTDGKPIDAEGPDGIGWYPYIVDEALAWAVQNGRGIPASEVSEIQPPTVTVAEMLEALRAPDLPTRHLAGAMLSFSLGAGLKLAGETPEDFEYVVAPQLSDLLGRAMAGESAAVDELGRLVTSDPRFAFQPGVTGHDTAVERN